MNNRNTANFAILILIAATVLWGSTFAFTKELTTALKPIQLITIRFGITAIIMFFLFFKQIILTIKTMNKSLLAGLLLLGTINFIAILLQTMGLTEITASNSGFITSLSIIFVPFIEFIFRKKKVAKNIRYAVIVSIIGVYILSYGFHLPEKFILGDLLTFFSGLTYAVYIIVVDILSKKTNPVSLMFFVFIVTTIIGLPFAIITSIDTIANLNPLTIAENINSEVIFNMGFLILLGTIIPYILMGVGQKYLDAQRAALIYLLEPVFGTIIAVLFFGEIFMNYKIIGGSIILLTQLFVILETNKVKMQVSLAEK